VKQNTALSYQTQHWQLL